MEKNTINVHSDRLQVLQILTMRCVPFDRQIKANNCWN